MVIDDVDFALYNVPSFRRYICLGPRRNVSRVRVGLRAVLLFWRLPNMYRIKLVLE